MSLPTPKPPAELGECISDFLAAVGEFREALAFVNAPELRAALLDFVEKVEQSRLRAQSGEPAPDVADSLDRLWGDLNRLDIRARDPDLGPTETLGRIERATGLVWVRLRAARHAAAAVRPQAEAWEPPEGLVVPHREVGGGLEPMKRALGRLEKRVDSLEARGRRAGGPMQVGLVNFFVGSMRNEIHLAWIHLHIGDNVDFSGLWRAVEAIVELTADFLETLRGWGRQAAPPLFRAAEAVRRQVRTVVSRVRAAVGFVLKNRGGASEDERKGGEEAFDPADGGEATPPPEAPGDFDLAAAEKMILEGRAPPEAWRPFITALTLSYTTIFDLSPLAGLTALQSLDLDGTQVADLSPLADHAVLQFLDLRGTRVSDVTPLAGLTALRRLYLGGTRVADVSPLTGLTALRILDLNRTLVRDVSPLAGLTALEYLYLEGPKLDVDLSSLAHLTSLQIIVQAGILKRTADGRLLVERFRGGGRV